MTAMQPEPVAASPRQWVEILAGLFAAAALLFSLVALAYHPIPVACAAILLSLLSAGMSARHGRLAAAALAVSGTCFVAGVAIAILTDNPLW